jgi:IclR family acetate operon transcriptional repressor
VPNPPSPTLPAARYQIQSVARAAELLDAVADAGTTGLGVTEIASTLGVAKSSALALARTLAASGLLRPVEPGPRYLLGLTLLRLGDLVSQQTSIVELALPILRDLAEVTGLTARLAQNEEGYPVFVERIDGSGSVRFHAPLGQREHTITDVDSMLAELQRTRVDGYSIDDEEEADGVFCVGAAFVDHLGHCAGALSVTGLKAEVPQRKVRDLGLTVSSHAGAVTALLHGQTLTAVR